MEVFKHSVVDIIRINSCIMRFGCSISEFIQGEWIVVIFMVAGFKFEL